MITCVPSLHLSTNSSVTGSATVTILSRADNPVPPNVPHSGTFKIDVNVQFDPGTDDYPTGTIQITADLTDSVKASFHSTTIELINSFGKHNPTTILTGRCRVALGEHTIEPKGCKYWVIIADNKVENQRGTPDIAGFVVTDRVGNRIAYGMGPVTNGFLTVIPR
jgi:hypothetical protein